MVLQMWHSRGGDGRVPGGRRIHQGVYKVSLLFIYDGISGSDVFEKVVCLVGTVQGEEGAARLAVSEDRDFQLFIV